ncbi:metallo-beta-lactamase type 2 [bacterium MnTg04]|nr:metallo-beta-lactamase type 2 [bacterium MnTg04]
MRKTSYWLSAALLISPAAAWSQEEVEIKVQQLTEHVYMLEGRGGNIGLSIGDDGVFMIDDQYAPLTPAILEAIGNLTDQPVKFVLNTHWHGDHTGGNENLGNAGAIIFAHDKVRKRMSTEQFRKLIGGRTPPAADAALPTVTFNDRISFFMNDDEIQVFHVAPAHTDTDSLVYFASADVLHMGDVFFNKRFPFIDVDLGGSIDGTIHAVNLALEMTTGETRIIPGHGPLASRQDLKDYRDILLTVRNSVAELIAQESTLEQVLAAQLTESLNETWNWNFINGDRLVELIYADLAKDPQPGTEVDSE